MILTLLLASVLYQDPVFVRLSDGRVVPFGQGTICTEECPEPEMESDKKILLTVGVGVGAACAVLCRPSSHREGLIPPVSQAPTPEAGTLLSLGAGLLGLSYLLKRKRTK